MKADFEQYIYDIVESSSSRLGNTLRTETTRLNVSQTTAERPVDATESFFIDGVTREHDCILILSNRDFPTSVYNAAIKSNEVKSVLGSTIGWRVCTPILTGSWEGQTFGIYKRMRGFSKNKYLRRIQALWSVGAIFQWLEEVFKVTHYEQTDTSAQEKDFVLPLHTLRSNGRLDKSVSEAAATLEEQVARGCLRTFNCLEHGDFWFGNILFSRNVSRDFFSTQCKFKVIDWAGCKTSGYPGIDALRISMSLFGRSSLSYQKLNSYCSSIGFTKREFALHSVCSLGSLHMNLDRMPEERFNALALNVVSFLNQHGYLDIK